ncbi:MAG TPA: diguanylate cyclase [Acidimicrobiales bacterium]|nr:diguanylate cyclase [Acidimicrobiales bacterium]
MDDDHQAFDLETVLNEAHRLLADYPDALVLSAASSGLRIPMPDTLALDRHLVLEGRSLLDHVVAEDTTLVAKAWYEALRVGQAEMPIRLANAPDQWLMLHFADLRPAHGILLAIVVPETVEGVHVEMSEAQPSRPRYATLRQDNVAHVLGCDEAFTLLFGWTEEDLVGKPALDMIHPDDQARAIEGWMSMLATHRPHQMRCRRRCKDGQWIWLDTTLHNFLGQPGRDHILVEMIDVSVEMAAQESLAEREQLLQRLAQALPVGLFQVEADRRVVYSNERLHQILGTEPTDDLGVLLATVTPEDRSVLDATLAAVLNDDGDADVEIDLCLADSGEKRRCHVSSRPLNGKDGTVTGAIVCVADITESARMHLELEDKATFDMLTRCYNRGSTMAALDRLLSASGSGPTGVIFIDLDLFKPVNDLLGHAAGDELLVAVAHRLGAAMRDDDIVGRVGGDEFLVVCPHIGGADDALVVARRIGESLTGEIALAAGVIDLRASIGVACSSPAMTADALVARADKAMYESKRQGEGVPVLYSSATEAADVTGPPTRRRASRRLPGAALPGLPEIPVLLGIGDVAACLGVAESDVRDLVRSDGSFPLPVGSVSSSPVWSEDDILAFRTAEPVYRSAVTHRG